jgi:hypothetical protein
VSSAPRAIAPPALLLTSLAVVACHGASSMDQRASAAAPTRAARVRIDGAGAFSLHSGDSVVIILNDREAWRGVFDSTGRSTDLQGVLNRLVPGTDSVLSADLWTDRDVAARYHLGGRRPSVILIRTAPPPE